MAGPVRVEELVAGRVKPLVGVRTIDDSRFCESSSVPPRSSARMCIWGASCCMNCILSYPPYSAQSQAQLNVTRFSKIVVYSCHVLLAQEFSNRCPSFAAVSHAHWGLLGYFEYAK